MDPRPVEIVSQPAQSLLATNKVLRNTYALLAITLAFSACVAAITAQMALPNPGILLTLVGVYGLMFLTEKNRNNSLGLVFVFLFTGFLGYTVGPLINLYITSGASDAVILALGGTALTFFSLSAYTLITKKDMSFLGGMLTAGFIVAIVAMIASWFLMIPALHLAVSTIFILLSSGVILMQTSAIIHGGEQNYISATVALFVSIYNIFVSLLSIIGINRD